jgi:hypothetical protein
MLGELGFPRMDKILLGYFSFQYILDIVKTLRLRARASKGGSYITEVGPAYPRDLLARALLAPPASLSTAPSHLASSLA